MNYYAAPKNPNFVGRTKYWSTLQEIDRKDEASIIVIYGRRRVGKTELIEQFFHGRPILKFEGLQPLKSTIRKNSTEEKQRQIRDCLHRLGRYVERSEMLSKMHLDYWREFFDLLRPYLIDQEVVLYFEELQWLSNYNEEFLSDFKPLWDEELRHNPKLRVVISGSAPSFITQQFLSSSAMYNRSNHMIKLKPFTLSEIKTYLNCGEREALLAAITVGGIPEYLKQIKDAASVYVGLCKRAFKPDGFFRLEKDRVFISALASNQYYEQVIHYLSTHAATDRTGLYQALTGQKDKLPGGSFTELLQELVALDFVDKFSPLTKKKNSSSRGDKYTVGDEYLRFYFKFIYQKVEDIDKGKFEDNPMQAINRQDFSKLLGFAFESWCRKNEFLIAKAIGFGGVIEYDGGSWFQRKSSANAPASGAQIDLMYIRKDSKVIICEIKYNNDSTLNRKIFKEVQQKVDFFLECNAKYARYTIETALICSEPPPKAILDEGYFNYCVTADELFGVADV